MKFMNYTNGILYIILPRVDYTLSFVEQLFSSLLDLLAFKHVLTYMESRKR